MDRFLLSAVVLQLMLALAPAAGAQGQLTTLYSPIEGESEVQGINSVPVEPSFLGTFKYATTFTPTRSGSASLLSMRGQCVINFPTTKTCDSIGEVSIPTDADGKPSGTSLGTTGFYLVDALNTGDPVRQQCGTLTPRVQLTAGTKYWAVMSAPEGIGWLYYKEAATETVRLRDLDPVAAAAGERDRMLEPLLGAVDVGAGEVHHAGRDVDNRAAPAHGGLGCRAEPAAAAGSASSRSPRSASRPRASCAPMRSSIASIRSSSSRSISRRANSSHRWSASAGPRQRPSAASRSADAVSGCSARARSPAHTASTSSTVTGSGARSARAVNSVRCLAPSNCTGRPSTRTSSGPRTLTSTPWRTLSGNVHRGRAARRTTGDWTALESKV